MNFKFRRQLFSVFLALIPTALAVMFFAGGMSFSAQTAHALSSVRYVSPTGSDTTDCSTSGSPCLTLQYAIDQSFPGDEIRMAAGTYSTVLTRSGTAQVALVDKDLTISGGYTTTNWAVPDSVINQTAIDPMGAGRGIMVSYATATLEGLYVLSGNATGQGGIFGGDAGGGIFAQYSTLAVLTTTLANNVATTNGSATGVGGGLAAIDSSVNLLGNTITGNTAQGAPDPTLSNSGGGLYIADLFGATSAITLTANFINNNVAGANGTGDGGGAYLQASSIILDGNTFDSNRAGAGIGLSSGGGLSLWNTPVVTMIYNQFLGNQTGGQQGAGGGIYANNAQITSITDTIAANTSGTDQFSNGGGVFAFNGTVFSFDADIIADNTSGGAGSGVYASTADVNLVNTVLKTNVISNTASGAGMYLSGASGTLNQVTITGNSGGDGSAVAVDAGSTAAITNTIIATHTTGITVSAASTATVNGVLFFSNSANTGGTGTLTVTNAITGDPVFDPIDGYHLLDATSAAVDAGVNSGITTDFDGDPRPDGVGYDLGADELLGGGFVDGVDIGVAVTILPGPTVQLGDTVVFPVQVFNGGGVAGTNVVVNDLLSPDLTYVGDSPSQGIYDPVSGDWMLGTVPAAGNALMYLTATVNITAPFNTVMSNTVSLVSLDQTDTFTPNNIFSESFTVTTGITSDLQIIKQVNNPAPAVGDAVVFTLTLVNNGPDIATNITVNDPISDGLLFQSAQADNGSYDPIFAQWHVPSMDYLQMSTLVMTVTVDTPLAGQTVTNTATIGAADQSDPFPDNNSASVAIAVQPNPATATPTPTNTPTATPTNTPTATPTNTPTATPTFTPTPVQYCTDPHEPNDGVSIATDVGSTAPVSACFKDTTDQDAYGRLMSATDIGKIWTVELGELPSGTQAYFFDPNGGGAGSLYTGGSSSTLSVDITQTGTYYLLLVSPNSLPIGGQTYQFNQTLGNPTPTPTPVTCTDSFEPNDSTGTAGDISTKTAISSCLSTVSDQDYFARTMAAGDVGKYWHIGLSMMPEGTKVTVLDPEGTAVAATTIPAGGIADLDVSVTKAGQYILWLVPAFNVPAQGKIYSIGTTVDAIAPAAKSWLCDPFADPYEPNSYRSGAYALTLGLPESNACFHRNDDQDFYRVDVTGGEIGQVLDFMVSNAPTEVYLAIYGPNGLPVKLGAVGDRGGVNHIFADVIQAGTYTLQVSPNPLVSARAAVSPFYSVEVNVASPTPTSPPTTPTATFTPTPTNTPTATFTPTATPTGSAPQAVSVAFADNPLPYGAGTTMDVVYRDAEGCNSIEWAEVYLGGAGAPTGAHFRAHVGNYPVSGGEPVVQLVAADGTVQNISYSPTYPNSASNADADLAGRALNGLGFNQTWVTQWSCDNATDLRVTWAFQLKNTTVGAQDVYGLAKDITGREGTFKKVGSTQVLAATPTPLPGARNWRFTGHTYINGTGGTNVPLSGVDFVLRRCADRSAGVLASGTSGTDGSFTIQLGESSLASDEKLCLGVSGPTAFAYNSSQVPAGTWLYTVNAGGSFARPELELNVNAFGDWCVWSFDHYVCSGQLNFDNIDLWFTPAADANVPPTDTPTAVIPPTATPTATATPTQTPTPQPTPTGQPSKLVGKVCVFADSISTANGKTTATGNLFLGKPDVSNKCTTRLYHVSDVTIPSVPSLVKAKASWTSSGSITVAGVLEIQPNKFPILASDVLNIDRTTGDVTVGGKTQKYISKLLPKDFDFDVGVALKMSVLNDFVEVNGGIDISNIPENPNLTLAVRGRIHGDGSLSMQVDTPSLLMSVAGGSLKAEQLAMNTKGGVTIGKATLTFPGIEPILMTGLTIDEKGLQFKKIAGTVNFDIPALNMGNFFILEGESPKNNQDMIATLHVEVLGGRTYLAGAVPENVEITALNAKYKIEIVGRLRLPKLPANSNVKASGVRLTLKDGKLTGGVNALGLTVAGRAFNMKNLNFTLAQFREVADGGRGGGLASPLLEPTAFKYKIIAGTSTWSLPKSWQLQGQDTKIYLKNVTISDKSPFINFEAGGVKFSLNRTFWLGGKPNKQAGIAFKLTEGELKLTNTADKYTLGFTSEVTFMLGGQKSTVGNVGGKVKLLVDNGKVTTDILGAELGIAGVTLKVDTLKYDDNVFTAKTASLTFPKSWGKGNMAGVTGLKIDGNGVSWTGITGGMAINNVKLGSVLQLRNMTATVKVNAKSEYELKIKGTVDILAVNLRAAREARTPLTPQDMQGVSGTVEVLVSKDGKVTGTVTGFSLELVGIKLSVNEARFKDDMLFIREAKAELPKIFDSPMGSFTLTGMTIGGPKGFEVKGGKFKLPNFSVAGMGVEDVYGEFTQDKSGFYTIAAGAKLNFEMFSVSGRFKMVVQNGESQLRQVYLKYSGTPPAAIGPLDGTGLYITEIWGQFDMNTQKMSVSFGLGVETAGKVKGKTMLKATASVTLELEPKFKLSASAELYLIGMKLAKADVVISDRGFSVDAELRLTIIKITGFLAFGLDADDEFTLAAGVQASIVVKKDAVWKWIPPFNLTIGPLAAEGGRFCTPGPTSGKACPAGKGLKKWGGQAYADIIGFKVYAFVGFDPLKLDAGLGASPYKVNRPTLRTLNAMADRMGVTTAAGRDSLTVDVLPSRQIALVETIHLQNQDAPLPLIVTQADGQTRTLTPSYEQKDGAEWGRVYILDNPPVGTWLLQPQSGNTVDVIGTDPAPSLTMQVTQLRETTRGLESIRVVHGSPARIYGDTEAPAQEAMRTLATQRILDVTSAGQLRLTWQSNDNTNADMFVQIYAEDTTGKRWPVTTTNTLNGMYDWTPSLPSGVYTFTIAANDGHNMPVISQVMMNYTDITPPNPPQEVTSHVLADGSARVSWNDALSDPDVLGYTIEVDGVSTAVFTVTHPVESYVVGGMDAGSVHTVAVRAYDRSYNHSDPVTVSFRAPDLQVIAQLPANTERAQWADHVQAAFNQPVNVTSFSVKDATGAPVAGSTGNLTYDLGAVAPEAEPVWGATFRPADGWLSPGTYTATLTVSLDAPTARALQNIPAMRSKTTVAAGTTSTFEWTFTVEGKPTTFIYLPLVSK